MEEAEKKVESEDFVCSSWKVNIYDDSQIRAPLAVRILFELTFSCFEVI